MKTYSWYLRPYPANKAEHLVSDSEAIVYTFSTQEFLSLPGEMEIALFFTGVEAPLCIRLPRDKRSIYFKFSFTERDVLCDFNVQDTNTVIRIGIKPSVTIYVNEVFVGKSGMYDAIRPLSRVHIRWCNLMEPMARLYGTLVTFSDLERGMAEAFAEKMKNLEVETGKETGSPRVTEQAQVDRDGGLNVTEKALEHREKELNRQYYGDGRGDANGNGYGDGGDDGLADEDHTAADVHPPDADLIKVAATVAWPRAVHEVLSSVRSAAVRVRHQVLMDEWVAARGDNISTDAYDYFVYSMGVAWPKAVLEGATESKLAKIQEKRGKIMRSLGFASY